MTTHRLAAPTLTVPAPTPTFPAPALHFPDTPKDDMQNLTHLNSPGYIPVLQRHLGSPDAIAVLTEFPIGWRVTGDRRGLLSPDLLIAFDVEVATIINHNGYSIEYHGKPPDFVMEVASRHTARRDETEKRAGYATYGVPEYWRFDDTDGEFYSVNLAGDRLVNGRYEPIEVAPAGHARYWGYSAALQLYVCWEYGWLRWYDPDTGYLPTHHQEADARRAAELRQAAAELRQAAAEAGLAVARTGLATTQAALAAAEAELAAERAARLEIAELLRQLQGD